MFASVLDSFLHLVGVAGIHKKSRQAANTQGCQGAKGNLLAERSHLAIINSFALRSQNLGRFLPHRMGECDNAEKGIGNSMYPELMLIPMREELTRVGIEEAKTAEAVDEAVRNTEGTLMVVVNSVCGCAAGKMRPGIRRAFESQPNKPARSITVFAGQDREATDRARQYFTGYPPSSPSIGFLRDGKLVHMLQRSDIETRSADQIAAVLQQAFDQYCGAATQPSKN